MTYIPVLKEVSTARRRELHAIKVFKSFFHTLSTGNVDRCKECNIIETLNTCKADYLTFQELSPP
jgi:hypothetical protein